MAVPVRYDDAYQNSNDNGSVDNTLTSNNEISYHSNNEIDDDLNGECTKNNSNDDTVYHGKGDLQDSASPDGPPAEQRKFPPGTSGQHTSVHSAGGAEALAVSRTNTGGSAIRTTFCTAVPRLAKQEIAEEEARERSREEEARQQADASSAPPLAYSRVHTEITADTSLLAIANRHVPRNLAYQYFGTTSSLAMSDMMVCKRQYYAFDI
eukprot:scaffold60430_cov32-Prasinocladus_malaysianus.AAC.2